MKEVIILPSIPDDEKIAYIARHIDRSENEVVERVNNLARTPIGWAYDEQDILDMMYNQVKQNLSRYN